MRLDKFLQVSRLIKRRSLAQTACHNGRVLLNGKSAKPAASVKIGDQITLLSPNWEVEVRVTALSEKEAVELFELIRKERRPEE
ncbi:MAG: RNA-binding S4 domain-containing protein [Candidatus Atribacteria bacterium]|nr:RNA-binding S4 domain-containing protein [Candidatus Atribacteria bacterium]